MAKTIKGMTQSLRWLGDLLAFFQTDAITIPASYRERVLQTKKVLESDCSGIVNSVLDFAIDCALVDYTIETSNKELTSKLNNWLININKDLRGKIPVGIRTLAREYFRERWKGSSNLLLRTFWTNDKDSDLELPTTMFFVNGEDIVTDNPEAPKIVLGKEQYSLRIDEIPKHNIALPKDKTELIFIQKPYESWGTLSPIPFIIRRGLYRNLKFMDLMSTKGEFIISRALEYIFLMKKGTERMTLEGKAEMVYSEADLKKVKDDFASFLTDKKNTAGTPIYATGFDTEIQHLIPDYKMAINETLYAPIERKLLAGLGLIDIITGTSSTRRESILNPKPFIAEIKQGIEDFKVLLNDIVQTIADKNTSSHRKYFSSKTVAIDIHAGPVSQFIDSEIREHVRSMYDRGVVSIETYSDIVGSGFVNHSIEVTRRTDEKKEKIDELMYPHITQNMEDKGLDIPGQPKAPVPVSVVKKENLQKTSPDKKGPEAKNFKGVALEDIEVYEGVEQDFIEAETFELGFISKKKDGYHVMSKDGKHLGGPYATYKEALKRLRQVEYFKHKGVDEVE